MIERFNTTVGNMLATQIEKKIDPRRLDILGETGCAESVTVWNVDPKAPGVRLEQDRS